MGETNLWVGTMHIERPSVEALDYAPCQYGASKLTFRGPQRHLDRPYVACMGGTETYGRYLVHPFATQLDGVQGRACVNLGCVNAGIDSFVQDRPILKIAARAELCVVQVMGAHDLSNRFYRVHARRNDRFLSASPMLRGLYPEIDFTEFHFNRHMLSSLAEAAPDRFAVVRKELQRAWSSRMQRLLAAIGGNVVLLWLQVPTPDHPLGEDPLMVTAGMIDALRQQVRTVVALDLAQAGLCGDLTGMVHAPLDTPVAQHSLGPKAHHRIAEALLPVLREAQ